MTLPASLPPSATSAQPEPTTLRPATLALDGGLQIDPATGAIAPGIAMSVNNRFTPGAGAFSAEGAGDLTALPFLYARWTNPTVRALEARIAALEGAEEAMCTATGVAAIAATFFGLLKAGDHLIISDVCYAGAFELATRILPDLGIAVTPVNLSRPEELRAAIRPETRLIHAETPCNPLLRLTDLAAISAIAREHGILTSVDSTLATPVITRPLEHGVDLVIHSLTKFMNGHGDALGGCLAGRKELVERIRARSGVYLGAALSAQNAWLIARGVDTLFPRLQTASQNAARIARHLSGHPAVLAVTYPGLDSHPQADLVARQMRLPGGMLTFQTADPDAVAQRMSDRFRAIHYAFSLGHQRSICVLIKTEDIMASTYHMTGEALADWRRYAGDGVFRLSVGLEAVEDLIDDLDRALMP
jgi:cystathionine gamma-synthase